MRSTLDSQKPQPLHALIYELTAVGRGRGGKRLGARWGKKPKGADASGRRVVVKNEGHKKREALASPATAAACVCV